MKNSLIALATLAACGAACAQSSVTVYGLVDGYVGSVKTPVANGGSQTLNVVRGGGIKHSRIGFKGSEDLGGGVTAIFRMDGDFELNTGALRPNNNFYTGETGSSLFNNSSYVGFAGSFGEVRLGKILTPFDDAKGLGAAGFNARIFAPAAFVWTSNAYEAKPGNSFYYRTPSFSGLSVAGLYSLGENETTTASAGKLVSTNLAYDAGPLVAMLSYQTEQRRGDAPIAKFLQLNATYNLGVVKLLGAYGRVTGKVATVDKTNEYQFGVDVPVSSVFTLTAGYAWSKDDLLAGGTIQRSGIGIAGLYYLSKRTSLYGGVNDSRREVPGSADAKTSVVAVGIRHTF